MCIWHRLCIFVVSNSNFIVKTHSARYISDCLLFIASQSGESDITNLKLQKLLYYIQGATLSLNGQRMFQEDITKWQYGPVVVPIYHAFRDYGHQIISPPEKIDLKDLHETQLKVIEDVYSFFGQFSALKLMDMTHSESPWINAEMREEITDEALVEFFDTIVVKGNGKEGQK